MDFTVIILSARGHVGQIRCPRCHAVPGTGMALATPARTEKHDDMLITMATCQCGGSYPVYWRTAFPVDLASPALRPVIWPELGGGDGA